MPPPTFVMNAKCRSTANCRPQHPGSGGIQSGKLYTLECEVHLNWGIAVNGDPGEAANVAVRSDRGLPVFY